MTISSVTGSKHFALKDLGNGVYAAIATDGGWAVGNAGIIDLGDHTLVFDTFVNTYAASDLKQAAEQSTGKAVDYVVNSHAHRDHVRGNQVFTDARIIATRKTRDAMAQAWKARTERVQREGLDPIRRDVEEEFKNWASDPTITEQDKLLWEGYRQGILQGLGAYNLKLPDVTFETKHTFNGSKRTVEAVTFGGGHSASDALLYLPEEQTAFLGDLLFINYQPFFADGDPEELFRILDKVETLGAKTLIPGHGPVGTLEDIDRMHDYYDELQKKVKEVGSSGGDLGKTVEKPIAAPFNGWKWHSFYKANLEFLLQRKSKTP